MTSVTQRMTASREARKHRGGGHVTRTFSPLTPIIQRLYSGKTDEVCSWKRGREEEREREREREREGEGERHHLCYVTFTGFKRIRKINKNSKTDRVSTEHF